MRLRRPLTPEGKTHPIELGAEFSKENVIEVSQCQEFIGRAFAEVANRGNVFYL
jgi:hypothetical protein